MFCAQCGKEIPEESEFCRFCGKRNVAAGAAQPTAPIQGPPPGPAMGPPPQYTAPMPVMGPGMGGPAKPKRKWVLPVAILVALIVAAGVTLGLVFGLRGESPSASGPEATVNSFFSAVNKGDINGMVATFDSGFVKDLRDVYGSDYKSAVEDFFFGTYPDIKFNGLKFKTEIDGDTATVQVVAGSVTYTDEDGEKQTESVSETDDVSFYLVKSGSGWFIEGPSFEDILDESSSSSSGTSYDPVTPPVYPPDYTPNPQPIPTATQCDNCGGYGIVTCAVCNGDGGYNTEVESTCPTCFGTALCYYCGGTGYDPAGYGQDCPICGGWGFCPNCGDTGVVNEIVWNSCAGCGGSGYVTCTLCQGAGWL